jgi:ParB family chromosome partitioning protein
MLRLLKLPERIKEDLAAGRISSGHARALLGLESSVKILELHKKIVSRQLSVRETERLLKRMRRQAPASALKKKDIHLTSLQEKLQYLLGTRVKVIRKGRKGRIEISFFSDEELERIIDIVQGGSRSYGAKTN